MYVGGGGVGGGFPQAIPDLIWVYRTWFKYTGPKHCLVHMRKEIQGLVWSWIVCNNQPGNEFGKQGIMFFFRTAMWRANPFSRTKGYDPPPPPNNLFSSLSAPLSKHLSFAQGNGQTPFSYAKRTGHLLFL